LAASAIPIQSQKLASPRSIQMILRAIASLLWPHDLVWQIVFLCGGLAVAYFDKRAMFRRT
jgi:hypothetical protein